MFPFYPVDGHYDIRVSEPGPFLSVTVSLHRVGRRPICGISKRGAARRKQTRCVARIPPSPCRADRPIDPLAGGATLGTRTQGAAAMSVVSHEPERHAVVDLRRWAELAPPKSAPSRAALARCFLKRVATQTGIRVEFPEGTHFGPTNGPDLKVLQPERFFARLGVNGKIGFGESYMAREWDSVDLVELLEALARQVDSLVPRHLQGIRRWYEARQPKNRRE